MEPFLLQHHPHILSETMLGRNIEKLNEQKLALARYEARDRGEVIRLFDDSPFSLAVFENLLAFISLSSRPINSVCGIARVKRKYAKQKINFVIFLLKYKAINMRDLLKSRNPAHSANGFDSQIFAVVVIFILKNLCRNFFTC
jgi:hypothetical protein